MQICPEEDMDIYIAYIRKVTSLVTIIGHLLSHCVHLLLRRPVTTIEAKTASQSRDILDLYRFVTILGVFWKCSVIMFISGSDHEDLIE